jgi:hypothetical protein
MTPAISSLRRPIPTIRGCLERIDEDLPDSRWIQVRTVLPGHVAIRTRTFVGEQTIIARGIERVALSSLREREFVEVTFHHGRSGFMEAETIYVQPDRILSAKAARKEPVGDLEEE